MINAGFNPLQIISEKTGKSISQLKEEMSKGAISAQMVQQAFLDATAAGGKFYNMSENASKTINGQISMLQDAMDSVFNEIGTKTEGVIIKSIQTVTKLIQNYETIGKVLVGLVTTYGAYRTAVLLVTSATKGQTIAELALTKARVVATAAQKALNAAMLTNPYVALTTVIAGMAASLLLLRDNTTAAEKAQERFSNQKEAAAKKEQEHKNAINGLIETVRDDTKAMAEREAAMIALRNEYPNLFAQYDVESLKLAGLIDLTKDLNEEMAKRKQASAQVAISRQEEVIESLKRLGVEEKRIKAEQDVLKKMQKDYLMNYSLPEYAASLKKMDAEQLEKELGGAKHMASGSGVGVYEGMQADKEFYDSMVQAINSEIEARKVTAQMLSEAYKNAEEQYNTDLAAFEWAEKNKTKVTVEEYNRRKAAKEKSEKEFKAVGGDPKGKKDEDEVKTHNEQLAQQEKALDAQKRSDRERARTAEDMENMVEQARINAMKEGAERRRAQRELDNRKELQNLERQKQDYIEKTVEGEKAVFDAQEEQKAKNDKNYKKQTFDKEAAKKRVETTDPVVQQYTKVIEYTRKKQTNDTARDDMESWRKSMDSYLKEYGNYEAKKAAITREYEQQIADATNVWDKASLSQKMKEELAALDIEANKTTNAIAQLFGDMRDKSLSELEGIAEKGTEALDFLKGGQWDESKGKTLGISKETFEIWSKSPEKLKAIADALEGVRNTAEALRNPIDKITEGFKDLFNSAGDKNKIDAAFASIKNGVGELTNAFGFVSDSIASMGEALGNEAMTKISDAMNSTINVASQTMAGAEAGKVFGPWGMAIGAVVGMTSSLVTELSKAKDAVHDAEIERLAKEVEALESSYDALGKSIEKAYSVDASNLIAQQNDLLEQKKANLQLMIAEEQAKKNVDDQQVEAWKKQIEEIDATIKSNEETAIEAVAGQNVMSAIDSFASAYADAWASGKDAATASTKAVRNMLKNSLLEFLKGQLSDEVEAFNKKLAESMADGIIQPWEEEQLDALREKMDSEAKKYYEQTSQYWEEKGGDEQQEASRVGYETLSEDTGNELVGRALAQYESNLRMEESMRAAKESVDIMAMNQVQIRDIAAESRALIADSYLELQQIRENTGAIIKPIKEMSDRIRDWDSKIKSL